MTTPTPPPAGTADHALRLASELAGRGDMPGAIGVLESAVATQPDHPHLLLTLGRLLTDTGSPDRVHELLTRADALRPDQPEVLNAIAQAHRMADRPSEALAVLEAALKIEPTHAWCVLAMATLLRELGRESDADAAIGSAIDAGSAAPVLIAANADVLRSQGRAAEAVDALRQLASDASIPIDDRGVVLHALGFALDSIGDYDEAFEAFAAANALLPLTPATSAATIIGRWSAGTLAAIRPADEASERPVLIVGMPRSGTTLAEQILAAHPRCDGVGESPLIPALSSAQPIELLSTPVLGRHAMAYLAMLTDRVDAEPDRVIDKLPSNWRRLGFVSRMLPAARVIHCTRDPAEACLSAFMHNFGHRARFTRDLVVLAAEHTAHARVMHHWREVLELPIFEHRLETLCDEPAAAIGRLTGFLGLDFDDGVLDFHTSRRFVRTSSASQVRRPIQPPRRRVTDYAKHLGPLLEALDRG